MTTLEQVREAAMQLSEEERQELGWALLDSVQKEPGYEEAWAAEIARRIEDMDAGRVTLIPGEEVLAELREMRRAWEA